MTTKKIRKRTSRHERLSNPPPMRITARDMLALRAINDCTMMLHHQVTKLIYPNKNKAQERLALLWHHAYIQRLFTPVLGGIQNAHIINLIDRKGVDLLRREFGYTDNQIRHKNYRKLPSGYEHTLGLADIRVAIEVSAKTNLFEVATWEDEITALATYKRLDIGINRVGSVVPDGYVELISESRASKSKYRFMIEFDRGKEGHTFLKKKLGSFDQFFIQGLASRRYGHSAIRVLFVIDGGTSNSRIRLNNICEQAAKLSHRNHFWFATLQDVIQHDVLISPIWNTARSTIQKPLL